MTNDDLSARARTIIALMDQADEIKAEIKDRFEDAKTAGYTVSALRRAIKIARMDAEKRAKHDSEQSDLLIYLDRIEQGEAREAAE